MAKNTGKASEDEFERRLTSLGKLAYFYRLKDASDIRGLTGKIGHVDKVPSDYITIIDGITQFCEVKSTQNVTSFPFSLLKAGQTAHGARILAAGGEYNVYVENLWTADWYKIPLSVIRSEVKSSIRWDAMPHLKWEV